MRKICKVSEGEEKMLSPGEINKSDKRAKEIIIKINTTLKEADKDGTCAY